MRHYGSYKGRNPKTGKIVDVPPKRLPYFKVGKELKEKMNRTMGETKQEILQAPKWRRVQMEKMEDEAKIVKGEIEKRGYRLGPSGRGRSWYMKDVEWQNKRGYYEVIITEEGDIPRIFNNPVLVSVMEFGSGLVMITREYESLQAFLDGTEGKVIYQELEGGVSKARA